MRAYLSTEKLLGGGIVIGGYFAGEIKMSRFPELTNPKLPCQAGLFMGINNKYIPTKYYRLHISKFYIAWLEVYELCGIYETTDVTW